MMVSKTARSERIVVFAILGLAAALRTAAAIVLPDQSHALLDAASYRDSAAQLLLTWQIGNLFQMPLYPLLIAMTGPGLGQLGADIALSVTSVWLVYALADELFADQHVRLFAAAATACYPPLIFSRWSACRKPCSSRWFLPPSCAGTVVDLLWRQFSPCWRY